MAEYGNRIDGTPKGLGFFGELKMPSGDVATELSFDFDAGGKRIFAPLIVPTLSKSELDHLLSGAKPTDSIFNKAQRHALDRLKAGKQTFAQDGELFAVPQPPTPLKDVLR